MAGRLTGGLVVVVETSVVGTGIIIVVIEVDEVKGAIMVVVEDGLIIDEGAVVVLVFKGVVVMVVNGSLLG